MGGRAGAGAAAPSPGAASAATADVTIVSNGTTAGAAADAGRQVADRRPWAGLSACEAPAPSPPSAGVPPGEVAIDVGSTSTVTADSATDGDFGGNGGSCADLGVSLDGVPDGVTLTSSPFPSSPAAASAVTPLTVSAAARAHVVATSAAVGVATPWASGARVALLAAAAVAGAVNVHASSPALYTATPLVVADARGRPTGGIFVR
ncbi:hypothetical protein I4F81_000457 [Pyropia yezoensis]|uniref:Uncharacterized protein n=1 Tax=Pyropia yezoensis TaxID=2788 RepID=A0ACC3BIU5_PYRYE|nr:hypothetical protein I4F81_000457 [Neopyropia yezoensis]